jgi:hypothetical protein
MNIKIHRENQFFDFVSGYKLIVNGEEKLKFLPNETREITISPNSELCFKIGWFSSNKILINEEDQNATYSVKNVSNYFLYFIPSIFVLLFFVLDFIESKYFNEIFYTALSLQFIPHIFFRKKWLELQRDEKNKY